MFKNWKTTLTGILAGLPGIVDALDTAFKSGALSGKTGCELALSIGFVVFGAVAKDHNVTGGTTKQ